MLFRVMSRSDAITYSYHHFPERTVIISINDAIGPRAHFADNDQIIDVLSLFFDDVDRPNKDAITDSDAEKIVDFVNRYKNTVDQVVVHCSAGISRSAGVAAALMNMLGQDDSVIFDNPVYCPNMTCYRAVLNAANLPIVENEVQEKEELNIQRWREAHREELD